MKSIWARTWSELTLSEIYALCKDKKISIKESNGYYILNYMAGADFHDPYVKEARGIILDIQYMYIGESHAPACWGFDKFGNWWESYADKIDWSTAKVQEKVDGSIIKLWYDFRGEEWAFATNSCIYAKDANVNGSSITYIDLIKMATNYKDIEQAIKIGALNTANTYIFELISPLNKIVVDYSATRLIHLGTRNNNTGEELDINIGVVKPKQYIASSLEECKALAEHIGSIEEKVVEGFVVVDENYHRLKVKTPEYLMAHRFRSNTISHREMLERALGNKFTEFEEKEYKTIVLYYKYKISELIDRINYFVDYAKGIYVESDYNRKSFALSIADHPFSAFAFNEIFKDISVQDTLKGKNISWFMRFIEPYPIEKILSISNIKAN